MKQTKLISLLLVICLVAALLVPGTVAMEAKAADGEENDGLVVNKTAVANEDGTYTITLEAYATGESVTSSTEKDVPTDIILVLDDSGSMAEDFAPVTEDSFVRYYENNSTLYDCRYNQDRDRNKNLWYKVEGEYYSVSVVREAVLSYGEYSGKTNSTYYDERKDLYLQTADGTLKIEVTRTGGLFTGYRYEYTWSGGSLTSDDWYTSPDFSQYGEVVRATISDYKYTYSYTIGDDTTEIETSVGADNSPDNAFYKRIESGSGISRIDALKSALDGFVSSVNAKAKGPDGEFGTDDDVKHRVAVVSFADSASTLTNGLEDMTTETGRNSVSNAFNELYTEGATRADYGMQRAEEILRSNPVQPGEQRNRVVIFFTDGVPTSRSSFNMSVANGAINASTRIKGLGAKVYSVGIFEGADASSSGDSRGTETQKANWFMQNVSSNNGVPDSPSYYLSAADAGTLNSIFQQISDQIQEGGSSIELGAEAVVRDEISPYFKLPDDAAPEDISLSLVPCTGDDTWGNSEGAEDVRATIDGKQISVTGFDFSENWCGPRTDAGGATTYGGKKLVISFKVVAEPLFLGGNDVPTNASAGIYADSSAGEPVKVFPEPTVNVPIKEITVIAEDKNVYLLGDVTADQLKENSSAQSGTVEIDLDAADFGLEEWQHAYVEIDTTLTDETGTALTGGFTGLTEDTAYKLMVKVSPKTQGTDSKGTPAEEETGVGTAKVNVFKPEITWKDSEKNIGDVPNYEADNFDSLNWIHATETYVVDKMIGEVPSLTYAYDPAEAALTAEIPVKVTVKIGETDVNEFTTFVHKDCMIEGCKWDEYEDEYHFIVHVKSFDLTITKSGCNEELDPNQTFVFTVTGPDNFSMEVVIKGNGSTTITNLPAGTYTVTEDTDWSWRYETTNPSQTVTADSISNGEASVAFVNNRGDDHWLDGNAYCENEFEGISATK